MRCFVAIALVLAGLVGVNPAAAQQKQAAAPPRVIATRDYGQPTCLFGRGRSGALLSLLLERIAAGERRTERLLLQLLLQQQQLPYGRGLAPAPLPYDFPQCEPAARPGVIIYIVGGQSPLPLEVPLEVPLVAGPRALPLPYGSGPLVVPDSVKPPAVKPMPGALTPQPPAGYQQFSRTPAVCAPKRQ